MPIIMQKGAMKLLYGASHTQSVCVHTHICTVFLSAIFLTEYSFTQIQQMSSVIMDLAIKVFSWCVIFVVPVGVCGVFMSCLRPGRVTLLSPSTFHNEESWETTQHYAVRAGTQWRCSGMNPECVFVCVLKRYSVFVCMYV